MHATTCACAMCTYMHACYHGLKPHTHAYTLIWSLVHVSLTVAAMRRALTPVRAVGVVGGEARTGGGAGGSVATSTGCVGGRGGGLGGVVSCVGGITRGAGGGCGGCGGAVYCTTINLPSSLLWQLILTGAAADVLTGMPTTVMLSMLADKALRAPADGCSRTHAVALLAFQNPALIGSPTVILHGQVALHTGTSDLKVPICTSSTPLTTVKLSGLTPDMFVNG